MRSLSRRDCHHEATPFTVTEADTASAVGSGDLPVLGTPVLLAWCEATTCAAVEGCSTEGQTTVGTRVSLEHLAPAPVGETVSGDATVRSTATGGAPLRGHAVADAAGSLVGHGEVTRVVVDSERFLARRLSGWTPAGSRSLRSRTCCAGRRRRRR